MAAYHANSSFWSKFSQRGDFSSWNFTSSSPWDTFSKFFEKYPPQAARITTPGATLNLPGQCETG